MKQKRDFLFESSNHKESIVHSHHDKSLPYSSHLFLKDMKWSRTNIVMEKHICIDQNIGQTLTEH